MSSITHWVWQLAQSLWFAAATRTVGWVLVQSVWQGAVVAVGLAGVLGALRGRWAGARYLASCAALAAMVAWPVATAFLHAERPAEAPARVAGGAVGEGPREVAVPKAPGALPAPVTGGRPALPDLLAAAAWAWAAGVAGLAAWNLAGWRQVRRMARTAPVAPRWLQETVARLREKMAVGRDVAVRLCERVAAPAVVGVVRPVVLVPASALSELSADHLEALLLHELAHVRRHDYLINLIQTATETLLFYHPAAWWVSNRIRREREHCCDDLAAQHCGSAVAYARALAAMEELRAPQLSRLALGALGNGRLLVRIERLVAPRATRGRRETSPLVAGAGALVVAAAVIATGIRPAKLNAHAKTGPTSAPTTTEAGLRTVLPEDLEAIRPADYRITANDLLAVTLSDVNGPNTETIKQTRVTESGNISMPFLDNPVHAAGLTEIELEKAIVKAYTDARLIQRANVSVSIIEARGREFFITGAVSAPGAYPIFKSDFRLLEAIATAHGTLPSARITSIRVLRTQPPGLTRSASRDGSYVFSKELQEINIPADKVLAGDASLNIVIRPGDNIVVVAGTPSPAAGSARLAVRLVVGADRLRFRGKPTTWDQLDALLGELPDRGETVLELAPESADLPVGKYFEAHARAEALVAKRGLKSLSQVGVGTSDSLK
jgi:beta-lactamase regulating signal transducer with metallopeptidase domain/protein involved in polysaccharide export with SLBB domain